MNRRVRDNNLIKIQLREFCIHIVLKTTITQQLLTNRIFKCTHGLDFWVRSITATHSICWLLLGDLLVILLGALVSILLGIFTTTSRIFLLLLFFFRLSFFRFLDVLSFSSSPRSLERFFGILTENYAGAFPLWVAPTQVRLLPVTDAVDDYVQETARKLRAVGIRCDVQSQERLAKLVRNAEKAKIPVMCVVGEQEAKDGTLAVRTYADGDQGVLSVDDVLSRVSAANAGKLEKF